ncbi:MAG: flagellar biosynthesis protein FlhB [Firmicutes bacterium]|nr:flagellar biosynthesis protein FlhB [Bacillota bacterium]
MSDKMAAAVDEARFSMPPETFLRLDLRFFEGEKTEKATPRKKKKSREEGQVAKSQEIGTAAAFLAVFTVLRFAAGGIYSGLMSVFGYSFTMIGDSDAVFDPRYISRFIAYLFGRVIMMSLPVFITAAAVGIVSNAVQVGFNVTMKPLMPKFSRLNPMQGFKRVFSVRSLLELLKSLLKFGVIIMVIYTSVKNRIGTLLLLPQMELFEAVSTVGGIAAGMGVSVGTWFMAIAAADFAYTRWKHARDLRMTKQEVKEEYKLAEGNPQVKGQIKSKMREVSMRRMMQSVPQADVIITNPTRYAVALRYDRNRDGAPKLVAKGADYVARRIREIAAENKVQIVENKELARAIYASVEVGREIPPELYQAVAEILAFVYRLRSAS